MQPQAAVPAGAGALAAFGSKVRITNLKTFGVTIPGAPPDRPYVFVKLETNAGPGRLGRGHARRQSRRGAGLHQRFPEFLIGADPMPVEHHWQSMYVHSFYRAGPVIGSAISAIDQALWDLRGQDSWRPGVQAARRSERSRGRARLLRRQRANARRLAAPCARRPRRRGSRRSKAACRTTTNGSRPTRRSPRRYATSRCCAKVWGPDIDIAVDFHAKTSPTVASVIIKELDPLHLLWVEEPCPPENVWAMARIARRVQHANRNRRTPGGFLRRA